VTEDAKDKPHILGVRHHGPGSAASVVDALDAIDPAMVLIEGPADAEETIPFAGAAGMRPPIAILVHVADEPKDSAFIPFAEFSPEWQAIQWALSRQRPVKLIDLPVGVRVPQEEDGAAAPDAHDEDRAGIRHDPLEALAQAAGESDGETWWNALVEQQAHSRDVFPEIENAMTVVRAALEADGAQATRHALREELREAHMRLAIRDGAKACDGAMAVICGAWHVPALRADVPAKADRERLKGLEHRKTHATWVPWTNSRLATASGYGAGVVSPGWYGHLWAQRRKKKRDMAAVAARWQARVAMLLREEGAAASTAEVIDASRLAISLAALRGFAVPGLAEMRDASLAAICHGDEILLRLVERELVIGDAIGEIDQSVPRMPLVADLERWQRRLRMKPSATEEEISLDLRSETGLLKSTLLHRLLLIDAPWGQKRKTTTSRGTFRENWILAWQPTLTIKLADALRFGPTIESAAAGAALEKADKAAGVAALAELVEGCLLADLADAAARVTAKLQALSVNSTDIAGLMRAAAPLANVLRYGTARAMPVDALGALLLSMSAEICAGLAHAAHGLDEAATSALHQAMREFDGAVQILDDPYFLSSWQDTLSRLSDDPLAAPYLKGFAVRRLHDRGKITADDVEKRLSFALSPAAGVAEAGAWLEGFLGEASQLLLHDAALFGVIDRWLAELDPDAFMAQLPGLRRAFGNLDRMERRRLIAQADQVGGKLSEGGAASGDDARAEAAFAAALPLLKTILGLGDDGN
jgi:hypothetical protein